MLYNNTPNKWTKGGANGEHGEDHTHEVSSLAQWKHIANDHIDHYIDTATPNSLDGSPSNHHRRIDRAAANTAAEDEQGHRADHQPSSTKEIRSLSEKGLKASTYR